MTEIANQNSLNVTQERIDELKALKAENAKILDNIQAQGTALAKAKGEFETYKQESQSKIDNDRQTLAREHNNALPVTESNKKINELIAENESLKAENQSLKEHISQQ